MGSWPARGDVNIDEAIRSTAVEQLVLTHLSTPVARSINGLGMEQGIALKAS